MGSIAAAEVAREVLGTIGKGKKPSITKIAISKGYSAATAGSGEVQQTKTYQAIISPYAKRLIKHREKVLRAMESKNLKEEEYKVLADSISKLTHDIQILTGGATENIAVKPILDV